MEKDNVREFLKTQIWQTAILWSIEGLVMKGLSKDEITEKVSAFFERETDRFIDQLNEAGFSVVPRELPAALR